MTDDGFESLYRGSADPWRFATSSYERRRYRTTLDALRQERYRAAFEPGCSVGELTALLAERCDRVLAIDVAPTAVARARARCRHLPQVDIHCASILHGFPEGRFDLVVFSEIGYYFDARQLARGARAIEAHLLPNAQVVAVHWLGSSPDHRLHGDVVHQVLHRHLPLRWIGGTRHAGFRIDSWLNGPGS